MQFSVIHNIFHMYRQELGDKLTQVLVGTIERIRESLMERIVAYAKDLGFEGIEPFYGILMFYVRKDKYDSILLSILEYSNGIGMSICDYSYGEIPVITSMDVEVVFEKLQMLKLLSTKFSGIPSGDVAWYYSCEGTSISVGQGIDLIVDTSILGTTLALKQAGCCCDDDILRLGEKPTPEAIAYYTEYFKRLFA